MVRVVVVVVVVREVGRLKPDYSIEFDLPEVNRAGFVGGSNFQIGWSHDEQNDEQVLA